ncbi:MAG: tRNA pseudouridine(13) synthase TruD [Arenicellales bacterium]
MRSLGEDWHPARAWGRPGAGGRIRVRPGDFRVDEWLGFEASGDGPHVLLRVEKTGCNTVEVARALAAHAGARTREVGYCGLKDKHASCLQWFSVPHAPGIEWQAFTHPGVRVLECRRHRRKLRRGAHRANRFVIRVVLDGFDGGDLDGRLQRVRSEGVPNYFGEQRFGLRYTENAAALAVGGRLPRPQRSMTLSAIRSDLFNRVLDERVRRGTWNIALPGEYVNLDGTRSGFAAPDDDPAIADRVAAMDLHPTAPLYGSGPSPASGEAARVEEEVMQGFEAWRELLVRHGLKMERRATRCAVRDLEWRLEEDEGILQLAFTLGRGRFATAVLREVVDYRDVTREPEHGRTGM